MNAARGKQIVHEYFHEFIQQYMNIARVLQLQNEFHSQPNSGFGGMDEECNPKPWLKRWVTWINPDCNSDDTFGG